MFSRFNSTPSPEDSSKVCHIALLRSASHAEIPSQDWGHLFRSRKKLHSLLWSFNNIDWEWSWSSFSLKYFIPCLKAARALPKFWFCMWTTCGLQYSWGSLSKEHSTPLLAHSTMAQLILKIFKRNSALLSPSTF